MAENMIATLTFDDKDIRMVGTQDAPEWVAADVCKVLGISDTSSVLRSFKASEKGTHTMRTPSGSQEMLTVTEPGVYRLIFKSRKEAAERFRTWLTHDVLPCIRQHGCYPAPEVTVVDHAVVQVDAGDFCRQMGALIQTSIKSEIKPVETKVDGLSRDMGEVKHRLNQIEKRKAISEKTKLRHLFVVKNYYVGLCPCCRKQEIVNLDGERLDACQFDHWDRPSEPGVSKTWAVCAQCNLNLRDADWKNEKRAQFEAYQQCRREFELAIVGPPLPGIDDLDE